MRNRASSPSVTATPAATDRGRPSARTAATPSRAAGPSSKTAETSEAAAEGRAAGVIWEGQVMRAYRRAGRVGKVVRGLRDLPKNTPCFAGGQNPAPGLIAGTRIRAGAECH